MPLHFELSDKDFEFNASLDPMQVLERMGFQERSIYREGNLVRVHCPVHKDLVRKSLIIDGAEKTFKCQFARCPAHDGGLLIELVAQYYQCTLAEVPEKLSGQAQAQARSVKDLVFRGEMLINQGRAGEAVRYFEQAVSQDPRDEVTRCKLAALYLELEKKDEAYQEYLRAAESYAVRGELEKTLSIYNILIMLQPGAVKARKQLAFLFSRLGRPDAAAEQLKWVIDFYSHYGQTKAAIEACEQLLEADPESAMAHRILGRLYQQENKRIHALQSLEEASRLFVAQQLREEALETINEGMQVAPGSPRLRELLAEAEALPQTESPSDSPQAAAEAEQAFHQWLSDVDEKLDLAMGGALGALDEAPPAVAPASPAATDPPVQPAAASPVAEPAPSAGTPPRPAPNAPTAPPRASAPPAVPPPPAAAAPRPAPAVPSPVSPARPAASAPPPPPSAGAGSPARPPAAEKPAPPVASSKAVPPARPAPSSAPASPPAGSSPASPPRPASAPPRATAPPPPLPGVPRSAPSSPASAGASGGSGAAPPQASPSPSPPPKKSHQLPPFDTTELPPNDHRVDLCLADLKDLSRDQVEDMREQLIMMFNDVRRSYEEGLVSDWEVRAIKEFYKAFNMAVDRHLHGMSGPSPSPSPSSQ